LHFRAERKGSQLRCGSSHQTEEEMAMRLNLYLSSFGGIWRCAKLSQQRSESLGRVRKRTPLPFEGKSLRGSGEPSLTLRSEPIWLTLEEVKDTNREIVATTGENHSFAIVGFSKLP
jgi:hypothetical protein